MADHDSSYRQFFSHPRMVQDLLEGFVHEDWVAQLDFATLEPVQGSFVSEHLERREDDVIWRVRCRDQWLYIYLLIEFQSQPDPWMALRMLVYVSLLCQHLVRSGNLSTRGRLPPVFPLVLYNGLRPWQGGETLAELIEPAPGSLQRYQPSLSYLLLDEGRYPDLFAPAEQGNLAAALIQLENSRAPEELRRAVQLLLHWLHDPGQASLRRAFTVWLGRVLLPGKLKGIDLPVLHELEEVDAMLAERVKEWTREWEQQGLLKGMEAGRKEGREEGREEGRKEGEEALLRTLLTRKFGPLTPQVERRLDEASSADLLSWAERVLFAETIEQVFDDPD